MAVDYDLAKLYSREFFHFVRQRLTPDGFAVFDATGISILTAPGQEEPQRVLEDNPWPVYYHTLRQAGFETVEPYLTTLEVDNERAYRILEELGLQFDPDSEATAQWEAMEDEEEQERILRQALRRILMQHVYSLQQGFILVARSPVEFRWRDRDVPLHVLNASRFRASFGAEFPRPRHVDRSLVNSILRPTLPQMPVWSARLPF